VIPYEADEVTRLIIDRHDVTAFAPVRHLTVGGFRDWLLAAEPAADRRRSLRHCHCGYSSPVAFVWLDV
jgi:ethanolamine ammonia-lyase large subunit